MVFLLSFFGIDSHHKKAEMPFFGKQSGQPGLADRFEPLFSGLNFPSSLG